VWHIRVIFNDQFSAYQTPISLEPHVTGARAVHLWCEAERRVPPRREKIRLSTFENTEIDLSKRIWESNIRNGTVLNFSPQPYIVKIHDTQGLTDHERKESGVTELEVCDHYHVSQLREMYQAVAPAPLQESDSLLFNDQILELDTELWRVKIAENSSIYVERQELSRATTYVCGGCGLDVVLKADDIIMCRNCVRRILFKKRTRMGCQYNCR
jgi:DNA-directed RNA polymerase subunit RPC12/RpoP